MINFIVDAKEIETLIENIMMNYNYEYKITAISEDTPSSYFNIYILNYNNIKKVEEIRKISDDWVSIIILINESNNLAYYNLVEKRLFILDVLSKKDILKNRLKEDILIGIKNLMKRKSTLSYTYKGIIYNIPYDDILYIESDSENKRCKIKTKNRDYFIPKTLTSISKEIDNRFEKCSRSYIINLEKVRTYNIKANKISFDDNISLYEISRDKKKIIINYLRGIPNVEKCRQ